MRWVVLTPEVRPFCVGCEGPLRWHRLEGWHDQAWELTKAEQIWYDDVGSQSGQGGPQKRLCRDAFGRQWSVKGGGNDEFTFPERSFQEDEVRPDMWQQGVVVTVAKWKLDPFLGQNCDSPRVLGQVGHHHVECVAVCPHVCLSHST